MRGLDAYTELYADSRKWLQRGWADYFTPQLYWRSSAPQQRYDELLHWWTEQNAFGRHLWVGQLHEPRDGRRARTGRRRSCSSRCA